MQHIYQLTGMTCASCEAKVNDLLSVLPGITSVKPSKEDHTVTLSMNLPIPLETLQKAIGGVNGKYQIFDLQKNKQVEENTAHWLQTYKPILVIFFYITVLSFLLSLHEQQLHIMSFMRIFMSGFFLTFSFFKMLNLKSFAESYSMYDTVAKKVKAWGYVYAFLELSLGLAYAIDFMPAATNAVTLVVMTVSIVGILQSVWNKKKIQCACLGTVFNLPMSTVTIVEDAVMIMMSAIMLFLV